MDYKVNDYVRVTKLAGYDEAYGIEVGGIYQVVETLAHDVMIKAPNQRNRLMHLHQIEKCDPPSASKKVRVLSVDSYDETQGIELGGIYEVIHMADNGVYIERGDGSTSHLLNHQVEYVDYPVIPTGAEGSVPDGVHGLDMGHGQVTEGKRMVNTEGTREVAQKHLNETLDRLKVKQSEYDIHINQLEQELEETRELKRKNSREMTHVTATLMIIEEGL